MEQKQLAGLMPSLWQDSHPSYKRPLFLEPGPGQLPRRGTSLRLYGVTMLFSSGKAALLVSFAGIQIGFAQTTTTLNSLARDIERVESVREVKDVQKIFAQLAQFGRWSDMAALFSDNGTLQWGNAIATGPDVIETWLRTDAGPHGRHSSRLTQHRRRRVPLSNTLS